MATTKTLWHVTGSELVRDDKSNIDVMTVTVESNNARTWSRSPATRACSRPSSSRRCAARARRC
jgi:hypothetical protein